MEVTGVYAHTAQRTGHALSASYGTTMDTQDLLQSPNPSRYGVVVRSHCWRSPTTTQRGVILPNVRYKAMCMSTVAYAP
jgi:hypothetical protein